MKNYIGFVNDHSGSMQSLAHAAVTDYNALITSVKDAASKEMLDTVVSTVGIGLPITLIQRQVVISNPHVLKPLKHWEAYGQTPLYDGIGNMIELFQSLPDYGNENVSFLVFVTTDGGENQSRKYTVSSLKRLIGDLQLSGRWTFVFRVPKGSRSSITRLGVPAENIQEWETTAAGMAQSTQATAQAMDSYFSARSSGSRSSTTFYADAAAVNVSALEEVTKQISLYVVPQEDMGSEIRPFILRHRMEHLKGAAFYQLTKTENRVQPDKLIVIRDRQTGKMYAGKDARKMIGLPNDKNARLHPGDHKNFDLFIQSNSVNRKLVGGTGVLYWAKIGVPFTDADLAYLQPKPVEPPGPIVLPKVAATGKPTKSPIPVTKKPVVPMINGREVKLFEKRDDARDFGRANGLVPKDALEEVGARYKTGERWFVYL